MENYSPKYNYDYSSSADNCLAAIANDDCKRKPQNLKGKRENDTISLLLDSGSLFSMRTKVIAELIINNYEEAKWLTKKKRNNKNFSNKPVTTLGTKMAPIECNNWSMKNAQFVIVENGIRPLI